jgi:protoporphyrinogen oxidase
MGSNPSHRWAIIGGGMLGLTLAHRLRQQGKNVTLIEAAPELGGLTSAWNLDGLVWDRHYHVTLLSDSNLRAVLKELHLDEEMEWVTTRTGCYAGGQLYSVSNSLEFLRFPPLGLIDKFRLALTIIYGSRVTDWRRLEQIPVETWLTRLSGKRTFERFWLPLLRSKLGENYRATSAAFIWTTIQRLYAARRTGLKTEMFGYVCGGYARILDEYGSLLESEGVRIELAKPIESVKRADGKVRVTDRTGTAEEFERVVVTAAAPLAAKICKGLNREEYGRLEGVLYQGIVCASLLLTKPLGGFYVTNILDEGFPFTGVIEMTTLVRPEHLGGRYLVYLPKYLPVNDPAFELTDAEVEKSFTEGLLRMFPQITREDIQSFKVSRVRYVCPLSTLGYSQRVPPIETSVSGLYLVNSAHILNGTLNVNETIQLAEQAAQRFNQQ